MTIHQSAEDYLETILMLTERQGKVRSIDVVNELGFTKASVSIAMKKLRENGYIAVDGEGNLTLLPPGQEIAERIYSRHRLLTHFFIQLGVDEKTAAEDACKAEHILSEQTLRRPERMIFPPQTNSRRGCLPRRLFCYLLQGAITWRGGRRWRSRGPCGDTSWQSSRRTYWPACWPARRRLPCPPTCRGRPASRRARRGSWWGSPR